MTKIILKYHFFFTKVHVLNVFDKNEHNYIFPKKMIQTTQNIHIFACDNLFFQKQGEKFEQRENPFPSP